MLPIPALSAVAEEPAARALLHAPRANLGLASVAVRCGIPHPPHLAPRTLLSISELYFFFFSPRPKLMSLEIHKQ